MGLLNVFSTSAIVVLVLLQLKACSTTSNDDYHLMPPLFEYENMTSCFERHRTSLYCVVKTVVKPNKSSEIWRAIEKYSKHPSYHEHSLLDRGLCVDACVAIVTDLDPTNIANLDTERVSVEPYHLLSIPSERDLPQHQARYGRILNVCINYQLQKRYNLSGYSELERCVTVETHRPALDAYHIAFMLIVLSLIGAVVIATYADFRPNPLNVNNNLDNSSQNQPAVDGLLMEFSLRRTWSQLVTAPRSDLQRDFAFVEIFRMLSVFIILAIHVLMCFTAAPTANMRPLEELFGFVPSLIAVSIFPFQVHTFFTISGVMLAVHFLELTKTKARVGWSFLWKGIVMRYFRIFPVLFVLWLYQASWFDRLSQGPGDYRFFELEKDNCRTNGWLNFLFLNNYFRYNHMCMQQTWHLAADFQFFIAGLIFLLLVSQHPRLLWPMVALVTTFSVVAPIVNLYHHRLPGVILSNFKQLRFVFYAHRTLENDYMLAHPHTCSYFSGIFAGLAYQRYRASSVTGLTTGRTAWLLRWVPPSMVLLQAALAPLFYDLDYSQPLLWNAIYGALHRCCWGAMCAIAILYGATVWRGRHSWVHFHPVLLVISRLSFGVFMVQFCVLKSLARNATGTGVPFDWGIFFESIAYTWIVCYSAAMVLALMVELPAAAIFKRVFGSKKQDISKRTVKNSLKSD